MYLRSALQPDLFADVGDQFLADLHHLRHKLVRFASGLSRARDFEVAAWAGHAIGVEIGEVSDQAIAALAQCIVTYGVQCFCDSGAFGVFQRGLRGGDAQPLDFDAILSRYDALTDAIDDANDAEVALPPPMMVMPDIVGDQIASLDLVRRYRHYIRTAAFFRGVSRPIIPLQRGPVPLAAAYRQVVDLVESDQFVVGVPSNAVGIAPAEFVEFLREARPHAVHILGAFADSRLTPRLSQIVEAGLARTITVSADGNPLRSIIIEKGQGREGRREALRFKLGAPTRRRELEHIIADLGGPAELRSTFDLAAPDRQQRLVGLLSDFADIPPEDVPHAFGLSRPGKVEMEGCGPALR